MNLHSIAGPIVAAVNPWVTAKAQRSNGYTKAADFSRTPTYLPPVAVQAQMQALQWKELQQLDGLNIQGERRAMYLQGEWGGTVRADGTGGDLITLPDESQWLVVLVLENWATTAGWTKVAVVKQMAS